jgi:hypothetical protein
MTIFVLSLLPLATQQLAQLRLLFRRLSYTLDEGAVVATITANIAAVAEHRRIATNANELTRVRLQDYPPG